MQSVCITNSMALSHYTHKENKKSADNHSPAAVGTGAAGPRGVALQEAALCWFNGAALIPRHVSGLWCLAKSGITLLRYQATATKKVLPI